MSVSNYVYIGLKRKVLSSLIWPVMGIVCSKLPRVILAFFFGIFFCFLFFAKVFIHTCGAKRKSISYHSTTILLDIHCYHALLPLTQLPPPPMPFICSHATFTASLVPSHHHQRNYLCSLAMGTINRILDGGRKCRWPIKIYNKFSTVSDETWIFELSMQCYILNRFSSFRCLKIMKNLPIILMCVSLESIIVQHAKRPISLSNQFERKFSQKF